MKKDFRSELIQDLPADLAGGSLIAAGVYNFASAAEFPIAGINGISLIFYQLFGLPIGAMALLLNIPIILGTYRILGQRFLLRSVKSMLITSTLIDTVAPRFPLYTGDRLLAALCCGVLCGIGYALIFMRGSSTGGADFITLSIRAKYPHLTIGNIMFVLDVTVILLGTLLVSRNVESLIYGVIISWLLSTVMDRLMYGISQGKVALIITEHSAIRISIISGQFHRGSTVLRASGGYTGSRRDIVLCACNKKQMYGIRRLIRKTDPAAFLVIMESSDVVGEGFRKE